MAKQLFVRIAGVLGATSLAVFFLGLIPFLGAGPTAGAGFNAGPPAFTVNREFKGDRLPLPSQINSALSHNVPTPKPVPVGCDTAFSPISAPRLAYVYGRCVT